MTISNAHTLLPNSTLSADLCVVGAGAAGITLARELREQGLRVLLLESGDFEPSPETQDLYRGSMSGIDTWAPDNHRWRYFGGSTNRWAGWCMPLEPEDFVRRDHVPLSGWPIRRSDLDPYYARAQQIVQIGSRWEAASVAETLGRPLVPAPSGHLATRLFRYSPPTRFGSRYRRALEESETVEVVRNANVVGIELAGGRVSHLRCRVLGGPSFTVEADRYVLAMGGLENARLLLASNVGNESGFVGRCFMEHPHLYGSSAWLEVGGSDLDFYTGQSRPAGEDDVLGVLALSREIRDAEGLLDLTISMHEESLEDASTGEVRATDVAARWRAQEGTRLFRLTLRAEQSPFEKSRVTLTDEVDPLGVPRIDVHWAVRDEDLRGYRRSMEILGRELGAAGLGRMWTPHDAEGRFQDVIAPGGHHMGTTRMSADPSDGVVDADCRCHEVANLYIAGSSVFATGGSANPTLTIVALAARLADHLAEVT
jgi:choline dehydrogenase-like flavoprotein